MPSAMMPPASLARLRFAMSNRAAIAITDTPHLRVHLIVNNMQDGAAAALRMKRPTAIGHPAPCELGPVIKAASLSRLKAALAGADRGLDFARWPIGGLAWCHHGARPNPGTPPCYGLRLFPPTSGELSCVFMSYA